jgi:hypothetical protein
VVNALSGNRQRGNQVNRGIQLGPYGANSRLGPCW